jgi:hypothetical protein
MAVSTKKRTKKQVQHEAIVNDAPKLHSVFEPGDVSMQGDLAIVCIDRLPLSARPTINRQLATGDTQGSRHVLERGDVYTALPKEVVELIREANGCDIPEYLVGPVFVSPPAPTEHDLTHPEHGHQGFPASAICAVVYQRNLDQEERERRTQD